MKVKINKPIQGFSYFGGEVADLSSKICAPYVKSGQMVIIPETDDDTNNLPEDLPGRLILAKAGLETVEDVLKVKETLQDIKGIGKMLASEIAKYLEK